MPLILGCIDSDPARREHTMKSLGAHTARWPGMRCGIFSSGDLAIAWGAPPTAPLDSATMPDGRAAFAIGSIVDARDQRQPAAKHLLDQAEHKGASAISGRNGYYCAALKDADGSVWIGADLLGYYPLYWWSRGEILVFASAPGLIRGHPLFSPKPSALGIAGVLMTMHLIDNQTIWEGVRRLPAGAALRWTPTRGAELQPARYLEPTDRHANATLDEAVELLHEALQQSVASAAPGHVSAMLSGGLDSRLLAGYARGDVRTAKSRVRAVTFGRRGDFEVHCARAVAKTLAIEHTIAPEEFSSFTDYALLQSELERSSNSFVDLTWWIGTRIFGEIGRPVLTGFVGNAAVGLEDKAWNPIAQRYEFEAQWKTARRYGLPEAAVRRLLSRDFFGSAVDEVSALARDFFESLPGEPWQKARTYEILNRQRYHVAPYAWRLSLSAWPELPYVDLRVLDVMYGLPLRIVRGRQLQRTVLAKKFPALARLPLDTNSACMRPIDGSWLTRALNKFYGSRGISRLLYGGRDRRTYYRLFDVNNDGWSAVRQRATRARDAFPRWFDRATFEELLPPAGSPVAHADAIVDGAGTKTLLGLTLSLHEDDPTPMALSSA